MKTLFICPNDRDFERLGPWVNDANIVRWIENPTSEKSLTGLPNATAPALLVRLDGENLQLAAWTEEHQMCPGCLAMRALALKHPREISAYLHGIPPVHHSRQWLTDFVLDVVSSLTLALQSARRDLISIGYDVHLPTLRIRQFQLERHSGCCLCANPVDDVPLGSVLKLSHRRKQSPRVYRLAAATEIEVPLAKCFNATGGMFGLGSVENRVNDFCAQTTGSFRDPVVHGAPMFWTGRTNTYRRSRIVGLLEAFERHAGLKMRGKRCAVFDSYRNLAENALDPRQCGLYEPAVYESGAGLQLFSDEIKLRWIWAYSLTEQRPLLVPLQLAYYGDKFHGEPNFVHENSNGCAAGTCLEEAIFFALLELIERDAFLIHWIAHLSPPQIDPATVTRPEIQFLIERLRRQSLEVFILDTRLDLAVPTVAAVAMRRDGQLGAFAISLGCSFDPIQAMFSALTEVASREVGFAKRTRFGKMRGDSGIADFSLVRSMEDHAALYGLPEALHHAKFLVDSPGRRPVAGAYADWLASVPRGLDLLQDLQHCIRALTSAGLHQILVVDQTTPEQRRAGFHTARVLVPGMMPMDFGYGRRRGISLRRLYSVPVKLGLRDEITSQDVNFAPHPFA